MEFINWEVPEGEQWDEVKYETVIEKNHRFICRPLTDEDMRKLTESGTGV